MSRMRRRVRAEREHRPGGFRRDARQFDRAPRHARLGLERVEGPADALEIGRAVGLRDDERVEARLDDRREVVEREPRVERVDPHEQGPVALRPVVDQLRRERASGGFRGGATESSRSRISASAPHSLARANLRSESPGTNNSERSLTPVPRDQGRRRQDDIRGEIRTKGKAMAKRKVIITCAVTGSIHTPTMSPYLPVTPEEIAASPSARRGGAAIVHLHARDPRTGGPPDPGGVRAFLRSAVAQRASSTSRPAAPVHDRRGARAAGRELRPEVASLNMGSMNFGLFPMLPRFKEFKHEWEEVLAGLADLVFRNTFKDIRYALARLSATGTRFEFECYDTGHLYNLHHFLERGLVKPPLFIQTVFGILGGIGPHPEDVLHMKRTADRLFGDDYRWSVLGAGRNQMPVAAMSAAMGGNVRVGLEDSLWIGAGQLAPSTRAGDAGAADHRGARPRDRDAGRGARNLSLKGGDRVGFFDNAGPRAFAMIDQGAQDQREDNRMAAAVNRQILLVEKPMGKLGPPTLPPGPKSPFPSPRTAKRFCGVKLISLGRGQPRMDARRDLPPGAGDERRDGRGRHRGGARVETAAASRSGDLVFGDTGWQDYAVAPVKHLAKVNRRRADDLPSQRVRHCWAHGLFRSDLTFCMRSLAKRSWSWGLPARSARSWVRSPRSRDAVRSGSPAGRRSADG